MLSSVPCTPRSELHRPPGGARAAGCSSDRTSQEFVPGRWTQERETLSSAAGSCAGRLGAGAAETARLAAERLLIAPTVSVACQPPAPARASYQRARSSERGENPT